ncbi:MAG: hypothetical protein K8I30_21115, partial [Anaerolineae bacterium]|nr:hypothetical protein [Anaerolineae bacterium]
MSGYVPLDIARWSNGDASALKGTFGYQVIRGLPFQISPIRFDTSHQQLVEIAVQSAARWVIIAHRLNETHLLEGEPIGRVIANYRFHFQNGEIVTVPVRERFEIGFVPAQYELQYFGHQPFLAVPDRFDILMPRETGRWEATGFRQMETDSAWPDRFFLWAWENPSRHVPIDCMSIEPKGREFLVGGVTVSSLAEHPFGREPRRPVII